MLRLVIRAGFLGVLTFVLMVGIVSHGLPDMAELIGKGPRGGLVLLDREGARFLSIGPREGAPVRARDVSPDLLAAVLAVEDRRFYRHFGLDPQALARAVLANLRAGALVQGGSTITQQTAKNVFLSNERTWARKARELVYALAMEWRYSKEDILTLYLNKVYLGAGAYGFETAAWRYFGKSARHVTLAESAMLAGLLRAPSRFAPHRNPVHAHVRARVVLERIARTGFADPRAIAEARANPARLVDSAHLGLGRYFADWVNGQVPRWLRDSPQELIVRTTYDPAIQRAAEEAIDRVTARFLAEGSRAQRALVVISHDGAVRAMIGGRSYADSPFNRAAHAWRQPGSAFKPVVYAAGFEAGLTPDSLMADAPVTIGNWTPRNHDGRYRGEIPLHRALALSVNSVAVRVAETAGRARVMEMAQRLGFTRYDRPDPANALGVRAVTLLDLVAAYAAFANGGWAVAPYGVEDIGVYGGAESLFSAVADAPKRVLSGQHAGWLTGMMREVVEEGTGRRARLGLRPVAGKTGTSQAARDAWFIGYSAQYVVGVWIGNDDNSPLSGVAGGGLPAAVWREVMRAIHRDLPVLPLGRDDANGAGAGLFGVDEGEAEEAGLFTRLRRWLARNIEAQDPPEGR